MAVCRSIVNLIEPIERLFAGSLNPIATATVTIRRSRSYTGSEAPQASLGSQSGAWTPWHAGVRSSRALAEAARLACSWSVLTLVVLACTTTALVASSLALRRAPCSALRASHARQSAMPAAANDQPPLLRRPAVLLFGDSLTERCFEEGGWGAALAHHFARKVPGCGVLS